jgi:glutathione synthase/RimK-type ligase-like ATP-grasp enzyme
MLLRIALVTCATLPDLDEDDGLLLEPLRGLGAEGVAAVWDDPAVDWAAFDLVVIRSTWDYTSRRDQFVAWARSVPRLANAADVVEWNTDKRYLADLEAAGLPVVPTTWMSDPAAPLPAQGSVVVKPAVGAGSVDAARFAMHDEHEAQLARDHAARLLAAGHAVMVQPYIDAIERNGETGVIFVGGEYSHAIRKGPMLAGQKQIEAGGLFAEETITSREPTPAELDVARRALGSVPDGPERLLYARVDLVLDAGGNPMLMELELTEPSLFMHASPGSELRFARAIVAHATRRGP